MLLRNWALNTLSTTSLIVYINVSGIVTVKKRSSKK